MLKNVIQHEGIRFVQFLRWKSNSKTSHKMRKEGSELYYEMIISPYYGTIETVSINQDSRIYEWEPLFYVKKIDGGTEIIKIGVSGEVKYFEVK